MLMTLSLRRIAIGVSGSSVENDHKVALTGAEMRAVGELPEHPWRT
jgi:hypothetical protein